MKTITFATTQMNLINCVEFLCRIEGEHTFFFMADTPKRSQQIKNLLNIPAYSNFFHRIIYCPKTNNRILNFLLTLFYLIRIRWISLYAKYDKVITGNYRIYVSRLLYKLQCDKNDKCEYVVCDDGLATSVIAKARIEEINNRNPYIFPPNQLIKFIHRNNINNYIPEKIIFYTIYNLTISGNDIKITNNYQYIKEHLIDFNVDKNTFNCKAIVLGQPLYDKNYISKECYSHKLIQYSKTVQGKIIYYAHPEENLEHWSSLGLEDFYYVNNFLPFEIIAALLPQGCRVVSFFSSVLMNLKIMNESLIPECIPLTENELLDKSNFVNLKENYICYKKENVRFIEFD